MGGMCVAPTCSDGAKNGTETDIDCGGPGCPMKKCAPMQKCLAPADCASGVCMPPLQDAGALVSDVCQVPSCTNGVKNGNETGIDCGDNGGDAGPLCPPCASP